MHNSQNRNILEKYLPRDSVEIILEWLELYNFRLKITKRRWSKFGDYSHPHKNSGHRITLNHDMNQYAFLITLTHEIAHLTVWNKYRNSVMPHGKEWKSEFKSHLEPFIKLSIFPDDINRSLQKYISNPYASSCTDLELVRSLRKYDTRETLHLEDIPEQSIFQLPNGKRFIKGERLRKRFKCIELKTRSVYLVSPVAEVIKENTLF
jgi:SprT protein